MMSRQTCTVLVLAALFCPGMSQAEQFRPSTYDECITDTMKGVASDVAARAIISSCRNQFPKRAAAVAPQEEVAPLQEDVAPLQEDVAPRQEENPSGTTRSLTPEELGRVTANAFVIASSYRITFRNGNEHLTITEVTIAFGDKSNPDGLRRYSQNVRIGPLELGSARYIVVHEGSGFDWASSDESESSWSIAAAKGID